MTIGHFSAHSMEVAFKWLPHAVQMDVGGAKCGLFGEWKNKTIQSSCHTQMVDRFISPFHPDGIVGFHFPETYLGYRK